jgi:lipid A 4'-phosphatase
MEAAAPGMTAFYLYAVVLLLSVALFWLAPGVDLFFSGLFYDPRHGFALAAWPPLVETESLVRWITGGILAIVLGGTLWLRFAKRPLWVLDRNALIFLTAALVIGPGIVANTVLKDHWGRARPYQIAEFGGSKQFTAAPLPADQCDRNCSFVSGHAALGFSLVSFGLLLPPGRRRNIAIGAALGFGGLVGLGRIAAGHHFLSDVVDAGLIVVATTWLLHRWLVVHDGATPVIAMVERLAETPGGKRILAAGALVLAEAIAIIWVDRAIADFFHDHAAALQPFFDIVQRFGLGFPYLVISALAFAVLRWSGRLARLQRWDEAMRAAAYIPAFAFAAIAASGLLVDLIKIVVGRTRPKLLFATGAYDFTWFGWQPDHWSFPSGHAATAAALMTALWCLWPRALWVYVAAAVLVAASRVVTGQHYLSDVIAGAVIGVVVTRVLAAWLLRPRAAIVARQDAAPDYRAV